MATRKPKKSTRRTPGEDDRSNENPAPPEATNYEHPHTPGQRAASPGIGQVRAGHEQATAADNPAVPANAPGALRPEAHSGPTMSTGTDNRASADTSDLNASTGIARMDTGARPQNQRRGDGAPNPSSDQLVRDLMTTDIQVCDLNTELYYVARMMAERDVGAIPVVENTATMKLLGIVTDRDIVIRAVAKRQSPSDITAADCMSTDLLTVRPDLPLDQCVRQMQQRRVRRAPVVDDAGRCLGIIAQADIAERAQPHHTATLVREISHAPGHQGAYH